MAGIHDCGFELVQHPPCSADFTNINRSLSWNLFCLRRWMMMTTENEIISAVEVSFVVQPRKWFYENGTRSLQCCWQEHVKLEGDCVEINYSDTSSQAQNLSIARIGASVHIYACMQTSITYAFVPGRELRRNNVSVNLWTVNERWLLSLLWCAGASSVTTNSCHLLQDMNHPDWVLVSTIYTQQSD